MAHLHRRSRVAAIAVLAAATAGTLASTALTGAASATPQHTRHTAAVSKKTPAKKPAHPKGFVTTDNGLATSSTDGSALVRDTKNGEHVISIEAGKAAGMGHLDYLTHKSGATKWTSHVIPGLRPITGARVEIHMNTNDNRISIAVFECDGVYVADTSIAAVRMPEPTQIQAGNSCATATAASAQPPVALSYASFGSYLGVMLPDPGQSGQQTLFYGSPGQAFHPQRALPTTDAVTVSQIAFDEDQNSIYAVGEGTNGTNKGIYVLRDPYIGGTWGQPVLVASLNSPTSDYTVDSVTAYRGQVWVGLERTVTIGGVTKHHLYVAHGTPSGQWDGVLPLPHAAATDTALRLLINPTTRSVHAAFTRVTPGSHAAKSGIMQEARANGRWSKPKFFTHWYRDVAEQITISSAGHAVIGYEQR